MRRGDNPANDDKQHPRPTDRRKRDRSMVWARGSLPTVVGELDFIYISVASRSAVTSIAV